MQMRINDSTTAALKGVELHLGAHVPLACGDGWTTIYSDDINETEASA